MVDLSPNHRIATSDFPEASLSIICPQATELFQGGIGRVLEFNPQTNTSRILAGYHDAVKCLATFHGEQRENLYEQHAAMEAAVFESVVYLENGLDVTVHSALCQMIGQNQYVVIDVSVNMGLRAGDDDSCMLMANELFMVFPDGRRSYINLEVSGERMYVIPLQLTKYQEVRGNMAFLIPGGMKAGMLIIGDYYNHAVCGKHHYMNFVWD